MVLSSPVVESKKNALYTSPKSHLSLQIIPTKLLPMYCTGFNPNAFNAKEACIGSNMLIKVTVESVPTEICGLTGVSCEPDH